MTMRRIQRILLCVSALTAGSCLPLFAGDVVMGVVTPNTPVSLTMSFTNKGKAPVQLGEITTSCDCLKTSQLPGDIVGPGETIKLPFTYKGLNPGRVSIGVLIAGIEKDQVLESATVSGFVADPSWMISPAELLAQKDAAMVIDTRSAERYQQAHLVRSINLPLFAVKTRSELRDKTVVLVDEGFASDGLLDEVNKLRSMGFAKVQMLTGGVIGWMRAGGAVEGPLSKARSQVAQILPAEAEHARRTAPWMIIETNRSDEVMRALSLQGGTEPLLIVTDDANAIGQIESGLGAGIKRPVYYVAGGKAAWTAYQSMQTALAAHTGQIFQTKPTLVRPMISGGCGSCGK